MHPPSRTRLPRAAVPAVATLLVIVLVGCTAAEKPTRPAEEVLADHNPVERKDDPRIADLPGSIEGHPVFVVDKAQVEAWTGLEMP